jgi:drug/metabolite transporter (DMT)-like permease
VVISGIVWVLIEPRKKQIELVNPNLGRGILFACLSTLMQSMAFVFSSQGVSGEFSPFSATLIRLSIGTIGVWMVIASQRKIRSTLATFNHDSALFGQLTIAAISGPVIAGSLILLSFQLIPVGVTTTLSHTTAIIMIPLSYFFFKERITSRAIIGTIVAIVGIAIMFS